MSKDSNFKLYLRLLGYAYQYKAYLLLSVLGFIMFGSMEALLVKTIEFFIDALNHETSSALKFLPQEITDNRLLVPFTIIIACIIRGIGAYVGVFFMSRVGLGVVNTLRKNVFSHLVHLPQSYFDKTNSGELVSLIIYNIEQVTGAVTRACKILFREGFTLLALLFMLLTQNWKLTLILFITTPVLAAVIHFASRYFLRVSRKIQHTIGQVTHIATESIQGIRLVKSSCAEKHESQRFHAAVDENLKFSIKYERVSALQTPTVHFVTSCALAVIFGLILLFWEGTPAAAVAYVTAAGLIARPIRSLSEINSIIQKGIAASETIFAMLDLAKEPDTGQQQLENVRGDIVFNQVGFHYSNGKQALDNINLTIKSGETVALVGQSGSGKTTMANLLMRFYDVTSGSITIDGVAIDKLKLQHLRTIVGLVNQQTVIFNDSLKANIAYGIDHDDIDQGKLQGAAINAHAQEFIQQLEAGFDSIAGESGTNLSGGQRQRIAIARAIYKDAPILILDEATSALDNTSEKHVQQALDKLKQGRTTVVIAHRLSTIENADKIVVMDKGKIVEVGDHQSLISKNGYYAELYQTLGR
ncbi:MAG: lipid A export permease/ATP-binding protein MsbA [Alteromonadaceae bacterium]|nr:MAG: lipid A export permease/ATP-binding protein MsbA [Alteromonadaceae bacterium]